MLHFVSARLSVSYLLLCVLGCLGVLQIQATRQRLAGLALRGGRGPRWQGYAIGSILIAGAFAGFYAFTPGIFVPGPAGSELVVLFGAGFILALVISLAAACFMTPSSASGKGATGGGQAVGTPRLQGRLWSPVDSGPHPTICVVPELADSTIDTQAVAVSLCSDGFVVLTVDWAMGGSPEEPPGYPDVLALLPTAMGHLLQYPEVDGNRLGVLGSGLGGDLVLRAAGSDAQIAAVAAVRPLLAGSSTRAGLELLRDRSVCQVVRGERLRRAQPALAEQLSARDFLSRITPRALLIIDLPRHLCSDVPPDAELRSLPPFEDREARAQTVARVAGRWFKEHL